MNIDINALLCSAARRLAGPDETLAAGEGGHFAQLLAGLTDDAPLLPEALVDVESLLPVQPGEEIPGEPLAEGGAADDQSTLPPVIGADDNSALPEIVLLTPDAVLPAQPALPDGWQLQQLVAQNAGADAQDTPLLREVTADVRPSRSPVPRQPLPLNQAANAVAETLPATLPQLGQLSCYQRNRDLVSVGAYVAGSDALLDQAIQHYPAMEAYLHQAIHESCDYDRAISALAQLFPDVTAQGISR